MYVKLKWCSKTIWAINSKAREANWLDLDGEEGNETLDLNFKLRKILICD